MPGARRSLVIGTRLDAGIGIGVALNELPDVGGQALVLVLDSSPAPRDEVFHAAEPGASLMRPRLDGLSPPTEAAFGLAGIAVAPPFLPGPVVDADEPRAWRGSSARLLDASREGIRTGWHRGLVRQPRAGLTVQGRPGRSRGGPGRAA
jgi:hypothetical protein